ncbi:organic cation transporter protein-like [Glandiceps talaboti]
MKHFDEILNTVGTFGRYQKFQCFFMINLCGITMLHQIGNTFYSASADHYCRVYNNQTYTDISPVKNCTIPYTTDGDDIVWNKCNRYDVNVSQEISAEVCFPRTNDTLSCDQGWVYDKTWYENTVVMEYDLVCDKDWMKQLSKSIVPLGNLIGVVSFGQISDIFGRRIVFIITLVLAVAVSIGEAFSPSYVVFIIGQFCLGLFPMSLAMTCQVLMVEIVGSKYRTMCFAIAHIDACTVYILLGVVAWLCNGEWRKIQLIVGLTWAVFLPAVFIITESPMWLMQKQRYDKCLKVLKHFARFNRTTLPDDLFDKEKNEIFLNLKSEVETPKERKYTLFDLLRSPRLRIRTLIMCFSWFACGFVYYGISLNTDQIGSNPYTTFILAGVVEIPARLLAWWLIGVIGRRWSLAGFQVIGGVALIISIIPQNPEVAVAIALLSKFCVAAVMTTEYVYSAEIYPTVVRNAGMGISSMCSGIGNIISPFVILLDVYWAPLPFVIMGCISVIAGLTVPILPETRNQRLPGTIEEGELFGTAKYGHKDKDHPKVNIGKEKQTLLPDSEPNSTSTENQYNYGALNDKSSTDTKF